MMATSILPLVGVALVGVYVVSRFVCFYHNSKEPPLVHPKVPFVGHVIGLLRDGSDYYSKMAKKCNKPIITLGLLGTKMYIVTSPRLLVACDRRPKVVSFVPYMVEFSRRILLVSSPTVDLISEDLFEESGHSLRSETMTAMQKTLAAGGKSLDRIVKDVIANVLGSLTSSKDSTTIDTTTSNNPVDGVPLFAWVRRFVTISTTNAIYGSESNPFQNPEVLDGFWATDKDFSLLGLMFYPDIIAPRGSAGRKRLFDGFRKYYASGGHKTASDLVKNSYAVFKKHGVAEDDIARFDLGVCTALLVNTIPAIGWTLCHVFSRPSLLAELRHGIEAVVFATDVPNSSTGAEATPAPTLTPMRVTVNIPQVTKDFPLLESVVREVLRIQSNNASARVVLKETLVTDEDGSTYLLQKDSMLVMPSAIVHASEAAWGPTAQMFDPARFLKTGQQQKISSSAWRTFGGGNAVCPGRAMAIHEITSILIIIMLKYDLEPCGESGKWEIPVAGNHIATSILTPVDDVRVRVWPREDVRGIQWEFKWGEDETVRG